MTMYPKPSQARRWRTRQTVADLLAGAAVVRRDGWRRDRFASHDRTGPCCTVGAVQRGISGHAVWWLRTGHRNPSDAEETRRWRCVRALDHHLRDEVDPVLIVDPVEEDAEDWAERRAAALPPDSFVYAWNDRVCSDEAEAAAMLEAAAAAVAEFLDGGGP
jgi:hypothetical protein